MIFSHVMELANIVRHPAFSNVSVEIKAINKDLRGQWLVLFQDSREKDENWTPL
jgi:hypothetical protein